MNQQQTPAPDPREDLQFLGFTLGIIFFLMGGLVWWSMSGVEEAGSGKLNAFVALAYRLGGKPLALGICFVPGGLAIAGGIALAVTAPKRAQG